MERDGWGQWHYSSYYYIVFYSFLMLLGPACKVKGCDIGCDKLSGGSVYKAPAQVKSVKPAICEDCLTLRLSSACGPALGKSRWRGIVWSVEVSDIGRSRPSVYHLAMETVNLFSIQASVPQKVRTAKSKRYSHANQDPMNLFIWTQEQERRWPGTPVGLLIRSFQGFFFQIGILWQNVGALYFQNESSRAGVENIWLQLRYRRSFVCVVTIVWSHPTEVQAEAHCFWQFEVNVFGLVWTLWIFINSPRKFMRTRFQATEEQKLDIGRTMVSAETGFIFREAWFNMVFCAILCSLVIFMGHCC